MAQVKQTMVFTFDELSDNAKDAAIEKFYDINVDSTHWQEFVFEDAKEIAGRLGIEIENIYYSGFSSQGDGAQFTGSYEYKKQAVKLVKEYAPIDSELHRIAGELQKLQRRNFYRLQATVKHSGRYYHENCADIYVFNSEEYFDNEPKDAEDLRDLLKDFMRWIYKQLELNYNALTSRESIIETIKANSYEFNANGNFPAVVE